MSHRTALISGPPSSRRLRLSLAALLTCAALALPAAAHVAPFSDEQIIRSSQHVVVATVAHREARWNAQHTLIVTDYTLAVEESLKGDAPGQITITVPGGTLDGETDDTCLTVQLAAGSRYLLFLTPQALPTVTPITGAWQGMFRELPVAAGETAVSAGESSAPLSMHGGGAMSFRRFVDAIRDRIAEVEATPAAVEPAVATPRLALPAKSYDPASVLRAGSLAPLAEAGAQAPSGGRGAAADEARESGESALEIDGEDGALRSVAGSYVVQHHANRPIVFNQLPSSFSFSPYDQYQMSYWNRYAANLFRVSAHPTGTWAFHNGVFDMAGFPNNAQMIHQFGEGWDDGVLGVTYSRYNGNGPIVEADIALNPAYAWTSNPRQSTAVGSSTPLFQATVLHELGHSWGLKHPWETQDVWWDSVMNYAPRQYRYAILWSDDTNAVRAAFPGTAIRDGAISSWTTRDKGNDNNPSYLSSYPSPKNVDAGGTFRILNPIKVENVGTRRLINPAIEVYLTPQRLNFNNAILLKTVHYSLAVPVYGSQNLSLGSFTVPRSVPPGTYSIGLYLRDNADAYQTNNASWTDSNLTLTVH